MVYELHFLLCVWLFSRSIAMKRSYRYHRPIVSAQISLAKVSVYEPVDFCVHPSRLNCTVVVIECC